MKKIIIIFITILLSSALYCQDLNENNTKLIISYLIDKKEIFDSIKNYKSHINDVYKQKFYSQNNKELWRFEINTAHVRVCFFLYDSKSETITIIDYSSLEDLVGKTTEIIKTWGYPISDKDKLFIYEYVINGYKRNYFYIKNK